MIIIIGIKDDEVTLHRSTAILLLNLNSLLSRIYFRWLKLVSLFLNVNSSMKLPYFFYEGYLETNFKLNIPFFSDCNLITFM